MIHIVLVTQMLLFCLISPKNWTQPLLSLPNEMPRIERIIDSLIALLI